MSIKRCLSHLIAEGLNVIMVDHSSTDDTVSKAKSFLGLGLLDILSMPWQDEFSLTKQIALYHQVVPELACDWVLTAGADEWLHSSAPNERLVDVIALADQQGYNSINFNEFVFIPLANEDFVREDYADLMQNYYYFNPVYPRLMRAHKNILDVEYGIGGGHVLGGESLRLFPRDMILRHYVVLSYEHACQKYIGRKFSKQDTDKGWHGNRVIITAENLVVTPQPAICRLDTPYSREFIMDFPLAEHFWQWQDAVN